MNASFEVERTPSQGISIPVSLKEYPGHTAGIRKKVQPFYAGIYSDGELYDKMKRDSTSYSFPKEEFLLENFNSDIFIIKTDVAGIKADIRNIKDDVAELKPLVTDVAVIKTEIKHITENTQKVPGLVTDFAVIKTTLDTTNKILIGVLLAIIAVLLQAYLT